MQLVILFMSLGLVAGNFELLILHTNDMHSRWAGIDANGGAVDDYTKSEYGGYIRLKMVMENEAKKTQRNVIRLNTGDTFEGTPCFDVLGKANPNLAARLSAKFVASLEFDAMSPGNHEFDLGIEGLVEFLNLAGKNTDKSKQYLIDNQAHIYDNPVDFTKNLTSSWKKITFSDPTSYETTHDMPIFVAANYIENDVYPLKGKLMKSVVRIFETKNGIVPVGIIGYLTLDTKNKGVTRLNELKPGTIGDEVEYVELECKRLRHMGVNIIIAVGHSGITIDKKIAAIHGISAVVGGHTTTFMFNHYGEPEANPGQVVGSYPTMVPKLDSKGNYITFTPVVQAYGFTKYLGNLALDFNDSGDLILDDHTNEYGALSTFTDMKQNPILLHGKITSSNNRVSFGDDGNSRCIHAITTIGAYDIMVTMLNELNSEYTKQLNISYPWVAPNFPEISRLLEGGEISRTRECELGGIIADSQLKWFKSVVGKALDDPKYFKYPFAVINGGSIKGEIGDAFVSKNKKKQVTQYDIMQVMDLDIGVVGIELKQAELKKMFTISITQWRQNSPSGRFLNVSKNVKIEFDFGNCTTTYPIDKIDVPIPEFNILVFDDSKNDYVNVMNPEYANQTFVVVMNSHMAKGRVGYTLLENKTKILANTTRLCWYILGEYLKDPLTSYQPRIKFINDQVRINELKMGNW